MFTAPGAPPHPCRSWHALRDAARFAAVGDRVEPAMAKELVEAPIERPVRVVVSAVVRVEKLPYKGINVGVRQRDASALTPGAASARLHRIRVSCGLMFHAGVTLEAPSKNMAGPA